MKVFHLTPFAVSPWWTETPLRHAAITVEIGSVLHFSVKKPNRGTVAQTLPINI
jgi:hypothetical protein